MFEYVKETQEMAEEKIKPWLSKMELLLYKNKAVFNYNPTDKIFTSTDWYELINKQRMDKFPMPRDCNYLC